MCGNELLVEMGGGDSGCGNELLVEMGGGDSGCGNELLAVISSKQVIFPKWNSLCPLSSCMSGECNYYLHHRQFINLCIIAC